MKNRIRFLVIIPLLLISFFLQSSTISVRAKNEWEGDFDKFSQSFMDLIAGETVENPYGITFNLEEDLTLKNNIYMVDGDRFEELTGSKISFSSDKVEIKGFEKSVELSYDTNAIRIGSNELDVMPESLYLSKESATFPLESVAKAMGFDLEYEEESVVLTRPYQTKRLIIKSYENLDSQGAIKVAEGYQGWHIYQYATEEETIDAFEYYSSLECVDFVDVDSVVTTCDVETDQLTVAGIQDSFSYTTWGADSMGVEEYSNYLVNTVGVNNLPEVVVAVLDTGLDSDHSWFNGRVVSGGVNYSYSTSKTSYVYEDVHGHGTHVAGTIVDLTLKNVKILPIKVMGDDGYGYGSSIIAGMTYATNKRIEGLNIRALNMSLGGNSGVGTDPHRAYVDAVESAYNQNILTIAAAGNDGVDVAEHSPSNVENAITVSAVGKLGNTYYRPSWSNFGDYIDVSAPGNSIISAQVGGGTIAKSGTSMAAPHIAGVVALLYSDSINDYTVNEIISLLDSNVIDLGDSGWDKYYGEGLVNIQHAFATQMEKVYFSRTETDCSEAFDLVLSSSTSGAEIYYTLDGTTPSRENGILYQNPIRISNTQRVSAIAYVINNDEIISVSPVKTITYTFYGLDVDGAFTVSSDGTLTMYSGVLSDVVVPIEVDGITVIAIGKNAFSSSSVIKVTLPSTVTTIDRYAFAGCLTIREVYAPAVTKIDMYAFQNCNDFRSLTDSHFPKLEEIGKFAFESCYNLENLNLTKVTLVDDYAFNMGMVGNEKLKSVELSNTTIIGTMAFFNCNTITSIVLPSVEIICGDAFRECDIIDIYLPSLKYLGSHGFYVNENLRTVDMPEVIVVGSASFYNFCKQLNSVNIPKVKIIGSSAFRMCDSLTSIDLPEVEIVHEMAFDYVPLTEIYLPKVKIVGDYAFNQCNIISINIPSVVRLYDQAFGNNQNLQTVNMSSCVEYVHEDAFSGAPSTCIFNIYEGTVSEDYCIKNGYTYTDMSNLSVLDYEINNNEVTITGYNNTLSQDYVIPSYIEEKPVTRISDNAFSGCSELTQINISQLVEVGANAFAGCVNLESVVLPKIEYIGDNAFNGCYGLINIDIKNVYDIGDYAFLGCSKLISVELSENINSIGSKALGYRTEEEIIPTFVLNGYADTISKNYARSSGLTFKAVYENIQSFYYTTFTQNGTTQIAISYVNPYTTGNIIIPSEYAGKKITKIEDEAFAYCDFITGIQLPSTITTIGDRSFYYCTNLKEINLDYVTQIDEWSFAYCESLQYVELPNITEVPDSAFIGCGNLISIKLPNVKVVEDDAFLYCDNLVDVYFPKVEYIGSSAFYYADNLEYLDLYNVKQLGTVVTLADGEEVINGQLFAFAKIKLLYLPKIEVLGSGIVGASDTNKVVIGKNLNKYYNIPFKSSITIYGYKNSFAESMANDCGNEFISIDEFAITRDLDSNKTFYIDKSAEIAIETTGFEQKYQWYRTMDTIANGVPIDGANSNTLTIDTSVYGTYKYFVVVTNWDREILTSKLCTVNIVDGVAYEINSSIVGSGTISPAGSTYVLEGESQQFTFTPNTGYYVDQIIIDGAYLIGSNLEQAIKYGYTFANVTKDHSIEVVFSLKTYTIQIIQSLHGNIECNSSAFTHGSNVEFVITPEIGYKVAYLLIDGDVFIDTLNSFTFKNISADHTISAVFEPKNNTKYTVRHWQESLSTENSQQFGNTYYTLVLSQNKVGRTDAYTSANIEFYYGFNSQPIQQVLIKGDGSSVVDVFYNRNRVIVNLSGDNGITSVLGAGEYRYGELITVSAVIKDGYEWKSWTSDNVDLCSGSSEITFEVTVPSENLTLSANTELKKYAIVLSIDGDGKANANIEKVVHGDDVVITLIPEEGWTLSSVYVNGEKVVVVDNQIIVSNVATDLDVQAVFEESQKTILGVSPPVFAMIVIIVILIGSFIGLFIKIDRKQRDRF